LDIDETPNALRSIKASALALLSFELAPNGWRRATIAF
jgi:hypothetical protein